MPEIHVPELETAIFDMPDSGLHQRALAFNEIVQDLFRYPLGQILRELRKFEWRESDEKRVFEFRMVKGIPFLLWGYNAGICTADDFDLWQDERFKLLAIVDKTRNEIAGSVELFEVEKDGKTYLTVVGIQPTVSILSQVKASDLYPLIEKALIRAANLGGYAGLYYPTDELILSNRPEILYEVRKQYPRMRKITLEAPVEWNKHPKPYRFQEVYEVWMRPDSPEIAKQFNRAQALLEASEYGAAGDLFWNLIPHDLNLAVLPTAWRSLGQCLAWQGRYAESAYAYRFSDAPQGADVALYKFENAHAVEGAFRVMGDILLQSNESEIDPDLSDMDLNVVAEEMKIFFGQAFSRIPNKSANLAKALNYMEFLVLLDLLDRRFGEDMEYADPKDVATMVLRSIQRHLNELVEITYLVDDTRDVDHREDPQSLFSRIMEISHAKTTIRERWSEYFYGYFAWLGILTDPKISSRYLLENPERIGDILREYPELKYVLIRSFLVYYSALSKSEDDLRQRFRQLTESGPEAVRRIVQNLHSRSVPIAEKAMDWLLGLNVTEVESQVQQNYSVHDGSGEQIGYEPIPYDLLLQLFQNIHLESGEVVYDLGFGYGRFLIYAGLVTEPKLKGVEIVTERVEHVRQAAQRLNIPMDLLSGNVLDRDLSDGDLFFMYNPFSVTTRVKVLEKLRWLSKEKKIRIVAMGDTLNKFIEDSQSWLKPVLRIDHGVQDVVVYESGQPDEFGTDEKSETIQPDLVTAVLGMSVDPIQSPERVSVAQALTSQGIRPALFSFVPQVVEALWNCGLFSDEVRWNTLTRSVQGNVVQTLRWQFGEEAGHLADRNGMAQSVLGENPWVRGYRSESIHLLSVLQSWSQGELQGNLSSAPVWRHPLWAVQGGTTLVAKAAGKVVKGNSALFLTEDVLETVSGNLGEVLPDGLLRESPLTIVLTEENLSLFASQIKKMVSLYGAERREIEVMLVSENRSRGRWKRVPEIENVRFRRLYHRKKDGKYDFEDFRDKNRLWSRALVLLQTEGEWSLGDLKEEVVEISIRNWEETRSKISLDSTAQNRKKIQVLTYSQ
ncbi:MAG: hypothetical protein HY610_04580 [Elusimicrobia bacterium]|nr:hypothetical protein [Elusimicrobiota bacterium]